MEQALPSPREVVDSVGLKDFLESNTLHEIVGKNSRHYQSRWTALAEKAHFDERKLAGTTAWHWPALFFPVPWAMYRRQYQLIFWFVFGLAICSIADFLTGGSFPFIYIVPYFMVSMLAHTTYLRSALSSARQLAGIRDPQLRATKLASVSGASPVLALIGVGMWSGIIIVFGIVQYTIDIR